MSPDVFISYPSQDEGAALRICSVLEEAGITCWIAKRDLRGGEPFASAIVKAIGSCRELLVVVSSSANSSSGVARELAIADRKRLPLIFVRLEDISPAEDIDFFGARGHWVDLFPGPLEGHAARIVEGARGLLDLPPVKPVSVTRLLWRAHRGKFSAAAAILAGIAVWLTMPQPCRRDYQVHVSLLDTEGHRVDEADISSNSNGAVTKSPEGYEIRIPRERKPADGRLIINASSVSPILTGGTEIRLASDCETTALIRLKPPADTTVRGTVIDAAGRFVAGARVGVEGYEVEAVVTGANGSFQLPAHGPAGSLVRLNVEKDGYPSIAQQHFAGPDPATIVLTR